MKLQCQYLIFAIKFTLDITKLKLRFINNIMLLRLIGLKQEKSFKELPFRSKDMQYY